MQILPAAVDDVIPHQKYLGRSYGYAVHTGIQESGGIVSSGSKFAAYAHLYSFIYQGSKYEKGNCKKGIEDHREIATWNISGLFSIFDYCENME